MTHGTRTLDKAMNSNTMRLIACRTYAFLFGGFGFCLLLGGLMMLYHSASGAPAEVQDALARAHLPTSSAQLMVITGAGALIFGALHESLASSQAWVAYGP